MKIHPLALKVPPQSREEFARLCESIEKGFDPHKKIITLDGMILDGRHREDACKKTGTPGQYEKWKPAFDGDTPEQFVLRSTVHRSLAQSQRAALAAELLPKIENDAEKRARAGKAPSRPDPAQRIAQGRAPESAEVAAKAAGTNKAYVRVAAQAKKDAPKVFEGMKKGEVSVSEAKRLMKAPERPKKQSGAESVVGEAPKFKELVNKAHALRRDIEALAKTPAGAELSKIMNRISAALNGVATDLNQKTPHGPCPFGPSCEVGCKTCQGRKWLTKELHELLPKELKK